MIWWQQRSKLCVRTACPTQTSTFETLTAPHDKAHDVKPRPTLRAREAGLSLSCECSARRLQFTRLMEYISGRASAPRPARPARPRRPGGAASEIALIKTLFAESASVYCTRRESGHAVFS
ncbi:hypothetical protein EVAR_76426_1 [Eumeta japonica]|uniref:Uncharacterized protein n=1 Tax=Eumeta variegata TaxID=151549 RepID=A0A4C1T8W8_EUMVA|nr:hypothetical protein EVAR_76426_1 [Eumeta japonica]